MNEYMKKNLSEMVNNKGYIWKGNYLYGALPPETTEMDILFEKPGNNILNIHEISYSYHNIYQKNGKNKRVLIQSIPRKQKKPIYSIMDSAKYK